MNSPAESQAGWVAIGDKGGKLKYVWGTEEGSNLKAVSDATVPGGFSWQQRRGWIEVAYDTSGATSAVAAIRSALSKARPGQCVRVPDGVALIDGGAADAFTVPKGVTFTGSESGFEPGSLTLNDGLTTSGTQFNITTTGKLIKPGRSSTCQFFKLYYPNQQVNAAPTAYDWAFYIDTSVPTPTVRHITAINPYQLLYANSPTRVDEIYGFPLSQGIHMARIADVMRVSNVHFNSNNYQHGATLTSWVQANGRAFVVEQAEQFSFVDCFAILYLIGIDFKVEATPDGSGAYGEWLGGGIDATQYCVVVNGTTALSGNGFKMLGASLVPISGGMAILCQDTVNTSSAPFIVFQGGVHGLHDRDVWIKSGSNATVKVHHSTLEGGQLSSYFNESSAGRIEYDHVRTPWFEPRGGVTSNPVTDRNGSFYSSPLGTQDCGAAYFTAQAASIGSTNLYPSAPPVGDYSVSIHLACTVAGSAGTVLATVSWTDEAGAQSYLTVPLTLTALKSQDDEIKIRLTGFQNLSFSTTAAGLAGGAQYAVSIRAAQR